MIHIHFTSLAKTRASLGIVWDAYGVWAPWANDSIIGMFNRSICFLRHHGAEEVGPMSTLTSCQDIDGEEPEVSTVSLRLTGKPETEDCKNLGVPDGISRFRYLSALGAAATVNHAYVQREKFTRHTTVKGDLTISPLTSSFEFRRSAHVVWDFKGSKVFALDYRTVREGEPDQWVDSNPVYNQFHAFSPDGVAFLTGLLRSVGSPFSGLTEFHDLCAQLIKIGELVEDDDESPRPSIGSLPSSDGWSRVYHSFNFVVKDDRTGFEYTIDESLRSGSDAHTKRRVIEIGYERVKPGIHYYNPLGEWEGARVYHHLKSSETHLWWRNPFGDWGEPGVTLDTSGVRIYAEQSFTYVFGFGQQSAPYPQIAGTGASVESRRALQKSLHRLVSYKRATLAELALQRFRHRIEQHHRATAPDELWNAWIELLQNDVNGFLQSNFLETYSDLTNLGDLVPPIDELKRMGKSGILSLLQSLGSLTLYHNFVLQPTIGEVQGLVDHTARWASGKLGVLPKQADTQFPVSRYRSSDSLDDDDMEDLSVQTALKAVWLLDPPHLEKVVQFLRDAAYSFAGVSKLWDVVPFSWLVDYFSGLGDVFTQFDDLIYNLQVIPLYVVIGKRYTTKSIPWSTYVELGIPSAHVLGSVTTAYYRRDVRRSPPAPPFNVRPTIKLSRGKWMNTASLVVNLIG